MFRPQLPQFAIAATLALGLLAAGYFLGRSQQSATENRKNDAAWTTVADRATPLKSGPWGNLEALPIRIEPPEEYLPVRGLEVSGQAFNFADFTPETLSALFRKAELTPQQRAELLDTSKWTRSPNGIVVNISNKLAGSLSPGARKTIYTPILQNPRSDLRGRTASFRADQFDRLFSQSGLPDEVVQQVKSLCFSHGPLLFFCDAPCVLEKIPSYEGKVRFLKTIVGKQTLLLKMRVTPDSDINSLVNYWSKAAWGKDIRPILESLARVPGGARTDIVHLLPPMPTACLYTFPFPSLKQDDLLKDCHWVALNFFRDQSNLSSSDHAKMKKIFDDDYYPVISDARYGDIIELTRPNGDFVHSAVFIADDIVYTKNAPGPVEPFMLMRFQDLIDIFTAFVPEGESLQVLILRNKYY